MLTNVMPATLPIDDGDEPVEFSPVGNNFGLQQQVRRFFISNGPFQITTSRSEIQINQIGNVMSVKVNLSRIPNGYEVAKAVWSKLQEKMATAGWELMFDETHYTGDDSVCFFVGGDDLLSGKLPL